MADRGKPISFTLRQQIGILAAREKSCRSIARALGVSKNTAHKYRKFGTISLTTFPSSLYPST